jgi:hypothetical protein
VCSSYADAASTDLSKGILGIANRNSHLEGTVKQKNLLLRSFLLLFFMSCRSTLQMPFFHWDSSYSLHCAKLPSGSRPHREISPLGGPFRFIADQKTFGSVPGPFVLLMQWFDTSLIGLPVRAVKMSGNSYIGSATEFQSIAGLSASFA